MSGRCSDHPLLAYKGAGDDDHIVPCRQIGVGGKFPDSFYFACLFFAYISAGDSRQK